MSKEHALIIGGTHGVGRVLVRRLAQAGMRVSVVGRREPNETDAASGDVAYYQADITDRERLPQVLERILAEGGPLRNLAFFQRFRGMGDDWQGEIAVSLTATKEIIEFCAPRFAAEGDKSIVAVSSIANRLIAEEQPASYHLGKAGVDQLVRFYAVTLGPLGIRVNSVCPGTMLKEESRHFYMENRQLLDLYESLTPLRRLGTAEECAAAVAFLLSAEASFVTGQHLVLDGGVSLQWPESLCRKITGMNISVVKKPGE